MLIGIVTDPGISASIGSHIAETVRAEVPADTTVSLQTEQLPPTADGKPPLDIWRKDLGDEFDLMLAVTELPHHEGPKPIMAQISDGIVAIFVPALGVTRARSRAVAIARSVIDPRDETANAHVPRGSRWTGMDGDRFLMDTAMLGRSRLFVGMIRANRPWRLVPTLSGALAAASATSAFGVFYSSVWRMAADMTLWRLAVVTVVAIAAMAVWLIVPNGLWEGEDFRYGRSERWLYNSTTLGTVITGRPLYVRVAHGCSAGRCTGGHIAQLLGAGDRRRVERRCLSETVLADCVFGNLRGGSGIVGRRQCGNQARYVWQARTRTPP